MKDLFVSYARDDGDLVAQICSGLRADGQSVWVDLDGLYAGDKFWPQICTGIDESSAFCFVLSPSSLASEFCMRELEHAGNGSKRVIPLVVAEPTSTPPASIATVQWLRWSPGEPVASTVNNLVAALTRDKAHADLHTSLLVGARNWVAERRDSSFLLRGRALKDAEEWLADAGSKLPPPAPEHFAFLTASRAASTRRSQILLVGVTVSFLVALGLALVAWHQRTLAVERLQDGVAVGDHIVFILDGRLNDVPGAAEVRGLLLESSIKLLERLEAGANDEDVLRRAKAATHVARGAIQESQGNTKAALEELKAAVRLRDGLSRERPDDRSRSRSLSIAHERLGELQLRDRQFDASRESFSESERITRQLLETSPDDMSLRNDLSYSLIDRGDHAKEVGQLDIAREAYQSAVANREAALAADDPTVERLRALSVALSRLGTLALLEGRLDDALATNEREGVIAERLLATNPSSARLRRDYAISLDSVARTATRMKRFELAESVYKKSLGIKKQLSSDEPTNVVWLRDLSVTYSQLADLSQRSGDIGAALGYANEDLRIAHKLMKVDPTGLAVEDLYNSFALTGRLAADIGMGQFADGRSSNRFLALASERLQAAVGLGRSLSGGSDNRHSWARRLGRNFSRLGDVLFVQARDAQALDAYELAIDYFEDVLQVKDDKEGWRNLFVVLADSSLVLDQVGRKGEAQQAVRRARDILDRWPLHELVESEQERARLGKVMEIVGGS